MRRSRVPVLVLVGLAFACESPAAPATCRDPGATQIYPRYSKEHEVCFDAIGDGATYTATSSDTDVVTADISGTTLTVTGQELGSARVTVTATDSDGTTQTVVYPVVTMHAALGNFHCSVELGDNPDTYDINWEGWVLPYVDLAEVYARHTFDDQSNVTLLGTNLNQGHTYNYSGVSQIWTESVDNAECSIEIADYTYASD